MAWPKRLGSGRLFWRAATKKQIAMSIFSLSDWLIAILFVAGTLALAFCPYLLGRAFFQPRSTERTFDLAGSVMFRIGALHALILALMFSHVTETFLVVVKAVNDEAIATADVHHGLKQYDEETTDQIRRDLASYVEIVISEEWPLLIQGEMSSDAWAQWQKVFNAVLDLAPADRQQEYLQASVLTRLEDIARFRNNRLIESTAFVPPTFWVVAVIGFVLICLPYFVFEPSPTNMMLLLIFAIYNGVVLYAIYASGSPFDGPVQVNPGPFEVILGTF